MGAGILAALGGAGGGAGGGADLGGAQPGQGQGSAEDLLAQIRQLLDQYLALGPDTPVAGQAQALADAIDSTQGEGTGSGAAPEGSAAEEAAETPGQEAAEMKAGEAPDADDLGGSYSGGDMAKARSGAKAFLRNKNKKAKAK